MYAGIAGGVLGVIVALSHGYLRRAIANVLACSATGRRRDQAGTGMTLGTPQVSTSGLRIPILVGVMVTLWL